MDSTAKIAKTSQPVSRNAHTEMKVNNKSSIGLLRSFRIHKSKIKSDTSANQNANPDFTVKNSETKVENSSNVTKKSHRCTVCEASFDIKDELTVHLIEKHGYRRTYQCPICKKKFASKDSIKKHMVENHKITDSKKSAEVNRKPHQCRICDASFDERQYLTKHINEIHDSFYKDAFLKKSQSNIPQRSQKQQNLNSISTVNVKTFKNDGNKKKIQIEVKNKENLVSPDPITLENVKTVQNCGNKKKVQFQVEVKNKENVDCHDPIKHENDKNLEESDQIKTLKCFACKASFSNDMRDLDRHINLVHGIIQQNQRNFQCPKCQEIVTEKKYLRNHIAWVHEGKKPNVCNSCNRCFLEIEELKEHNLKEHCKKSKAKGLEKLEANNWASAQSQFKIDDQQGISYYC